MTHEAGRERIVDREEGELSKLKATVGKKVKRKLEYDCKGGD